ncbi:hypothetical protein [Croceicoccus marinus]|jgi:hypothetical protein|nr:hypothetical protein [Croceicoccus marinus]|tara:strand:- start:342 stop:596 length:255 start_codon:yes stop_codon:yes gene_type:complete
MWKIPVRRPIFEMKNKTQKRGGSLMANQDFSQSDRAKAKQAARDLDERDLAAGRIDAASLQERNGFIPRDIARRAKVRQWNEID